MPKRSAIGLMEISSLDTLALAFHKAALGFRDRAEVKAMTADLDRQLAQLGADIRTEVAPTGVWRRFTIHDPKRREILAPSFRDRVLHHAIMHHVGPVLERALVDDCCACRVGKGTHAAVLRAQRHARRFPWFVKVDVRQFFGSVEHDRLMAVLRRRFKRPALLALFARLLAQAPGLPGRGLPIGALTSQHFANTYLGAFDRLLLERLRVRGMVRYMDDVIWWCDSRERARETLAAARQHLLETRGLVLKAESQIGRSARGVSFLGVRVLPGTLRLLARRRRRYSRARAAWEHAYESGFIEASALQRGYDGVLAVTAHTQAEGFRRAELRRRPAIDV